jgi:PAS domain S-box-containing protein
LAWRKEGLERLRHANELLETMFSSVDLAVAYMDANFNFIRVNRAYAQADGRGPEFFVGKNHFALYPNAENEAIFRRVVESGEPFVTYAKPFVYPEHPERGTTYWDWSLQPVRGPDGKVSGVVLSLMDVTERWRAQARLRESERRFSSAFHAGPAAMMITRLRDGLVLNVNESYARLAQYRREEMIGRTVLELGIWANPDDRARVVQVLEQGRPVRDLPTQLHTRTGEVRDALFSAQIIESEGEPCILGMIEDITDRLRAERQLKESEALYRLLFERNLAGVFRAVLNPETLEARRLDCNDAYARILGYSSREELVGAAVASVYFSPEAWKTYIRNLLEHERLSSYELCLRRKDGSPVWVLVNAGLRQEERGPLLIEGTMIDVTERKHAEERLRELAQRVVLMQEEERRRVAHELHEEVGQILASANMSMALVGLELPEGADALRERVRDAMAMTGNMIDQVRSLAHGLRPPALDTLGLDATLEEYCRGLRDKTRVQIEYMGDARIHLSGAEAITLYRLLQEALANAIKHAHADRIEVRLDQVGAQVRLFVHYNGDGFDPHVLDDKRAILFAPPGGQAAQSLGLANLRERIGLLGGSLEIQSSPGQETRLAGCLPATPE